MAELKRPAWSREKRRRTEENRIDRKEIRGERRRGS